MVSLNNTNSFPNRNSMDLKHFLDYRNVTREEFWLLIISFATTIPNYIVYCVITNNGLSNGHNFFEYLDKINLLNPVYYLFLFFFLLAIKAIYMCVKQKYSKQAEKEAEKILDELMRNRETMVYLDKFKNFADEFHVKTSTSMQIGVGILLSMPAALILLIISSEAYGVSLFVRTRLLIVALILFGYLSKKFFDVGMEMYIKYRIWDSYVNRHYIDLIVNKDSKQAGSS